MQRIKHISIPRPCHQNWQQMTPTDKGRHCQSCCKTVIDFNGMSNADVISHLSLHKNSCGRISDDKLKSVNLELGLQNQKTYTWKGLIATALLSMAVTAVDAQVNNRKGKSPSNQVEKRWERSDRMEIELMARDTTNIEIAPPLIKKSVVPADVYWQHYPLIGSVGGVSVTFHPFYKRCWYAIKRIL